MIVLLVFAGAAFLSPLERDVLAEVNALRTRPKAYAAHGKELLTLFRGKVIERPGMIGIATQEGTPAVRECIAVLEAQRSLRPLEASLGMSLAARQHANDLGQSGSTAHAGRDGSNPVKRLERFGRWTGVSGENLAFGPRTGRDVVLQLAIDDGVPGRGHRKNLLSPDFGRVGLACAEHKEYAVVCVMELAGGFEDRPGLDADTVKVARQPSRREPMRIFKAEMGEEGGRRWVRINDDKAEYDLPKLKALIARHPDLEKEPMAKKLLGYLSGR
jgi:hypothetical protein